MAEQQNPTPSDSDIERILSTIKQVESSGNYGAKAKGSSASGAYQFINDTWQRSTKRYGIGTEYKTAADAPPEVQDAVAARAVKDILGQVGGDVTKVPLVWYTGNPQGRITEEALRVNRGLTPDKYQQKWMSVFNQGKPTATAQAQAPAQAPRTPVQGTQVAAAAKPSLTDMPPAYRMALAANYLADTESPETSVVERAMEMLNEQQGGAAKNPLAGYMQAMGQESVNPFQFVQQQEEEAPRRAVPRMPVRMEKGGEVNRDEFDQQREQERQSRLVEQGLSYAMGPMDIRAVRKPAGYEARVSGSFNQVVPYMDFDPLTGTFRPTEVGVSYGQMGPEGGYRFQYGQPLPREGQPTAPPQVTGQYRRQLDRNSEVQASGYYVPIPGAKDQYGAQFRYLQRFADGGEAVSDEAIRGYLQANPTLTDRQIAAKMDEFNVSKEQMARATGIGLPEVTARYEATRVDPSTISEDVRQAVQSQRLTRDQYATLSNYFGNPLTTAELTSADAPTIRDFVNKPRTGFEFASFLATRGPRHGGNNPYGMTLYENLLQPYLNTTQTQFQQDEGGGSILDPITGQYRPVSQVDQNRYRVQYSPIFSGPSGSGETRTDVGLDYVVDPATGRATLASPYLREFTPKKDRGLNTLLGIAGTVAGYYFFPGMDMNSMISRGLITAGTEGAKRMFKDGGMANANPADIAEQMTVGTLPEGQRPAGEVFRGIGRDVVRGAQYLPYDLLGAPVDIATMAMRPFGYKVEKPVGGSEYLIEKARQAGIAQAPTGSAAETATRIGMGFVNPMTGARQVGRGIEAVEKGAETLGTGAVRAITGKQDITPEQIYQAMGDTKGIMSLGAPAAVKPGGGVVNADEMIDSLTNVLKFDIKAEGQKFDDIFKWIDTKARSYYEKQFGAPGDPLFRAFMSGDFNPQFNHINDSVRETYESTIKHGRDLMSSTSTADQRIGRAMLSTVYDSVTPVVAQYGPQTIRNRLLNPKFREEIQRYIMEERNLGPAKLTPKARLNYEKEIDSYLDEFAKTGNLSTKAPFDVTDINRAASQNIVDDIGDKVSVQTIKAYNLQPDEMHGFVRQWPGYGTALEKTHALPSAYSKNYPDYLATTAERQAIKFGEPTYSISKQPEEVHADLNNLLGYLNRTPSEQWKNTSFPDLVVKAQKDWSNITDPQEIYKRLNNYQKVTPKQRLIGTQEFMPVESKQLGEGATWRELDENGILIEGRLLRHCLSEDEKYRNFYKNGMSRFFALRDKEGKSYATIQIDRLGMNGPFANVHQIKGWKNDSVGKKYDKELMDFLNRYQANEINVPLRYTEESSFLPLSLAGGERVRVVEGDAPLVLQYVEFFRTLDRNLIDRGMATPGDLGDFNYVLDRIRDLPTEAQQKEFADTFLKAFAEGYSKPLKFIYHLGGWRTGQLGEPQPVWQNPPVNRAKGGMVDKPLYDRAA